MSKELNVSLLPDTYALSEIDFNSSKNYALYHATSGGNTAIEKVQTLVNIYEKIMNKMEHNK